MPKNKPPKPRNPIAPLLRDPMFRNKKETSTKERKERQEGARGVKHKKSPLDEGLLEYFQCGDTVEIKSGPLKAVLDRAAKIAAKKAEKAGVKPPEEKPLEATVKQPKGPANTVGINVDGEYHIVDQDDLSLIMEAFDDLLEMRYVDTTSGVQIPISGEEQQIYDRVPQSGKDNLYKSSLDEREREVARKMVSRGVLNRRKDDTGIYFERSCDKLSRF